MFSDALTDCDPVMILAEEIADLFKPGKLASTQYAWMQTKHEPIYSVEMIQTLQVFLSLIVVTFVAYD